MKILLFGATGMVGQGVLRECLAAPDVDEVVIVARAEMQPQSAKVRVVVHRDFLDFSPAAGQFAGLDACFFCLGVSSAGMKEAEYERVTYGFTLAAADTLARVNPGMTFIYVSGAGTDSSEKGRSMWARVKGRTENALLRLPLKAWMFRPGMIQPLDGIRSKTPAYRVTYAIAAPLLPLARRLFPKQVLSTRDVGQAMLAVARGGYSKNILETRDIRAVVTR
jgi:uncharacterized protein YbjT (DUF2867 family)